MKAPHAHKQPKNNSALYSCPQTGLYFIEPHHLPSRTISVVLISPHFSPSHTHTGCIPKSWELQPQTPVVGKSRSCPTTAPAHPRSHTPTAHATRLGGCNTRTPPPQCPSQAGLPSGSPHALCPPATLGGHQPPLQSPTPPCSTAVTTQSQTPPGKSSSPTAPPTPLLPLHREEKEDRFMLLIHFINYQNFQKPNLANFFLSSVKIFMHNLKFVNCNSQVVTLEETETNIQNTNSCI